MYVNKNHGTCPYVFYVSNVILTKHFIQSYN
jgi:hypothetical protein